MSLVRGKPGEESCRRGPAAGQAEDLVRKFFGAKVMDDSDTWVQRYTNCTPISYREWAEEHEDGAESDDSYQGFLGMKSACATAMVALLPPKPKALLSATPTPPETCRAVPGM